jgi:hypothetical protein
MLFEYELTGKLYGQESISQIVKHVKYANLSGNWQTLQGEDIDRIWIFNGKSFRKNDPYTAQSPLYSASDAVSLFNSGLNVYGQLVKQSVLGIIATRDRSAYGQVPMKPDEKRDVQDKMDARYGLVEGRDKFIITNKDLFFQSLLTNVGNLGLDTAFELAMNTICDRIGFQPELLSLKDATFENKKTAEVAQYNTQTIPFANKLSSVLTAMLGMTAAKLMFDFSDISSLQENEKESADIFNTKIDAYGKLYKDGLITQNEYLEFLDMPATKSGNRYYSETLPTPPE